MFCGLHLFTILHYFLAPKQILTALLGLIFVLQSAAAQADGEAYCDADNGPFDNEEVIDHLSHLWELPKNYDCINRVQRDPRDCDHWAQNLLECENNPKFMLFNCPKSCGYCHLKDPEVRSQRHPEAKAAVGPGDVNKMFERLLTDFPQYTPQVLSRDPWLVLLNDVFTEEECAEMIKVGGANFKRSSNTGERNRHDGQFRRTVDESRTSENDWCTGSCWSNKIINGMARKAENITLIPKENSEFFQVLRYKVGQYYLEHHDYIFGHLDLPIGPRVYTFFIYLNTPEAGGGKKFNKLDITVPAKKGSVAIWPSVLDEDPFKKEYRTDHEALPVEKGLKYGANMWLHMFNFQDPFKVECTG